MRFIRKTYELHSDKIKKGKHISMVLLSDLHLAEYGKNNQELIKEIRALHPDLIVSSGDLVTAKVEHDTSIAEKLLEQLAKEYPVYYAPGNHEERMDVKREWFGNCYDDYCSKLNRMGIHYLYNEHESIRLKDVRISIYGLALPLSYFQRMSHIRLDNAKVEELIGRPEHDSFCVLLAHHPRYAQTYFEWGADLILSGHVHGGVMRLGKRACISPDLSIFPRYGYGKFQKKQQHMIVSSGLGEHTIPFRIFNPKELVYIVIKGRG